MEKDRAQDIGERGFPLVKGGHWPRGVGARGNGSGSTRPGKGQQGRRPKRGGGGEGKASRSHAIEK